MTTEEREKLFRRAFTLVFFGLCFVAAVYGITHPRNTEAVIDGSLRSDEYNTITIDGCKYIEVNNSSIYSLTHKGNCPNH